MRLNLGCSDSLRGGEWLNVDIAPDARRSSGTATAYDVQPGEYLQADLALPWPWDDSSVDEIYAADIFEHIGDCRTGNVFVGPDAQGYATFKERHWSGRIHVMNESWRVLKPSGILTMECPDAAKGTGQWQDPTHVTSWTPNGLQYFADGSPAHKRFAAAYGITARFHVLSVTERLYSEIAGPRDGYSVGCDVWKFAARLEAVK